MYSVFAVLVQNKAYIKHKPFQNEMTHKTVTENLVELHKFVQLGQITRSANRHPCGLEDMFLSSLRAVQQHVDRNKLEITLQYVWYVYYYSYCYY